MRATSGWYPDPQDRAGLRYWDGGTWTDRVLPGQGDAPRAGAAAGRTRTVAAVAVAVLVAVAIGVGLGLRAREREVLPTAGPTTTGSGIPFGDPVPLEFESGEMWTTPLQITDVGVYRLLARGDGVDARMELREAGTVLAATDDGGSSPLAGSSSLDPMLLVVLQPGTYEVAVGDYLDEEAGSGDLLVEPVEDVVELAVGETTAVDIPADGAAVGYLVRDGVDPVTVDVRADDGSDLVMALSDAEGGLAENDDRGGTAADARGGTPLDPLTSTTQGSVVVVVWARDFLAEPSATIEIATD